MKQTATISGLQALGYPSCSLAWHHQHPVLQGASLHAAACTLGGGFPYILNLAGELLPLRPNTHRQAEQPA